MSWLTKIALQNKSVVALAVVAVLIVGAFAITSLKQELIPDISFPFLTIVTMQPGASPQDVEQSVTIPIETAIKGTPNLNDLTSYSNEGMSIMLAQFEFGTDMEATQAQLQQAIARLQGVLPSTAQTPLVQQVNFNDFPVVQLAVTTPMPPQQAAVVLQAQVVPAMSQIPGVGAVSVSGIQGLELAVRLRPDDLKSYGIAPQQVFAVLQTANDSAAAGTVTSGGMVFPVTVANRTDTVEAIRNLTLTPGGLAPNQVPSAPQSGGATATDTGALSPPATVLPATVTLAQVADVEVVPAPVTALTRTNGEPSFGLAVTKTRNGNTVEVANQVDELIPSIVKDLGPGTRVTKVVDQSIYIRESISSMWREGLLGALFAVLVILVFLRNWRSTVVAGLSIPLSVIVALIVLWGRGNSLNMLTLGGLTIAIGRVIDDSIVVLENTYRHLQEGDDVETAAYTATREVAGAITASTLTTVAVFLPLGFIEGFSAEYFRPFALTVTFALLASLVVAVTVIPVASTWLLSKKQVGHREASETTALQRAYLPVLNWSLGHKLLTVLLAVATFLGVMALGPYLKTNLFDSSAENSLSIEQQMPAGTDLARTSRAASQIEEVLAATRGVTTYQAIVGSTGDLFGPGGGTSASSSQAQFTVTTDPELDKAAIVSSVRKRIDQLAGVGQVAVSGESGTFGNNTSLEVRVFADDPVILTAANGLVLDAVKSVPGLANVRSNLIVSRPQIVVAIDQAKAAAAGVDPAQVAQVVTLTVSGLPAGTIPTPEGFLPARVLVPEQRGRAIDQVSELLLFTPTGLVPLSAVATVQETVSPAQITHIDGQPVATVTASVTSGNIGATSGDVKAALDETTLPKGASYEMAGAGEETADVFNTLSQAMIIAVLLVYIIMVGTFRSLVNPLILLVSIPFAGVGAVGLMLLTGTSLGMPSLIGLLMLIGIVVTNAIVLLDLIEKFRNQGMDAHTAVIEGARRRLRPILMTAVATIFALLPMAVGLGEGAFLSTPLAVVVIGGLLSSTLLTLVIVPVLYLVFDRLRRRPRRPAIAEAEAVAEAAP